MNYQDQVLALFGEANPVSDRDTLEDVLSPHLEALEQRTGDMTETKVRGIDPNRPIVKRERQRGPVYGVAAAVAVLIVGAVTWIVSLNDAERDVLGGGASPVDIARSFIEARDTWNGEAARSLVATDAVIDDSAATADEYLTNNEFERATGWRFMLPDCTETVTGLRAEVNCTYTMENAWSRALGVGPFTGSSFDFVIADGKIQELTHTFDFTRSGFSGQVWEVFVAWMRDNHPEDVDAMYDFSGPNDVPRRGPAAIPLWEQYTNEFVASMTESGTP